MGVAAQKKLAEEKAASEKKLAAENTSASMPLVHPKDEAERKKWQEFEETVQRRNRERDQQLAAKKQKKVSPGEEDMAVHEVLDKIFVDEGVDTEDAAAEEIDRTSFRVRRMSLSPEHELPEVPSEHPQKKKKRVPVPN